MKMTNKDQKLKEEFFREFEALEHLGFNDKGISSRPTGRTYTDLDEIWDWVEQKIEEAEVKMSSYEWARALLVTFSWEDSELKSSKVKVLDPDGWNRKGLENSLAEKITLAEFNKRLSRSTLIIKG